MKEKTNYGNWVPEKALYMLFGLAAVFLVITVILQIMLGKPVITAISGIICVLILVEAVYMYICHEEFAFGKGNMMAGVHKHLVDHLDWDGNGNFSTSDAVPPLSLSAAQKLFQKPKLQQ